MSEQGKGFNLTAYGEYKYQIIEKSSNEVIKESEVKRNHIFSGGLDQVAFYTWADCFRYCRLGKQTNPEPSSGAYEGIYGPNLQNAVLGPYGVSQPSYYNTGFVPVINGIGGFSGCATEFLGSGLKMRRTFDFPEHPIGDTSELPPSGYTEISWSPQPTGTLFSRVITTGVSGIHEPIWAYEGQVVRVIYELSVFIGPSGHSINEDIISGWNSSGDAGIQYFGMSSVNELGQTSPWDNGGYANEPSQPAKGFLSDVGGGLAPFGSSVDRSVGNYYEGDINLFSYTGGFNRTKRFFITKDNAVGSGYYAIGIGPSGAAGSAAENNGYVHEFYDPVNKELNFIVNARFNYSWNKITD